MNVDLLDKRVLFIAPRFFGYEQEIANELRRRGAKVDELRDRPFDTPLMAAVTRFQRSWIIRSVDRLYRSELERFGRQHYDLILVINGQTLSPGFLVELRSQYPRAQFVLYMWDSAANRRSIIDNLRFFDACFCFDRLSADQYGMIFRPLFFSSGFEQQPTADFDHHISFVGTAHTDRAAVIFRLQRSFGPDIRSNWYLFLQARWVFWTYKVINPTFKGITMDFFRFLPLAKAEVQRIFARSNVILDIEHPQQVGLTMRTFETIGASKKLVTTNVDVKKYDFYNPENICVVDRARPEISPAFLESPYQPIDQALYQKYRLEGWMDEILFQRSLFNN